MCNHKTKNNIEIIAHTVTALAFILGVFQFCSYRSDRRIENSLSKNAAYLVSEIKDARAKFIISSDDLYKYKKISNSIGKGTGLALAKWIMKSKATANEDDFFYIIKFYSSVYSCIDHDQCDLKYIDKFLLSDAQSFFRNFHSYLEEFKANKKNNRSVVDWTDKVENYYLSIKL